MSQLDFSKSLVVAGLVLGAMGAGSTAHARSDVHISVGVQAPGVHAQPAPVYVQPRPVYVAPQPAYVTPPPAYPPHHYGQYRHEDDRRGERSRRSCSAPRWDPRVRYAPGEVVRRHGNLFIARRASAHVWNVNSPPEWTPNYWAPAHC